MDPLKIYNLLPLLENYDNNVVEWIEDLTDLMRLCKIKDAEGIYTWAIEAVDTNVKPILKRLVTKENNGEIRYPNVKEIQKAIEQFLDITDGDKLAYIQNLKISENESIKSFNDRYRKLYHDLPRDFQKIISVKNYRNSIKSRTFPYSQVFISKCNNLQDAYSIAETAEDAERECYKSSNTQSDHAYNRNNMRFSNISMVTQHGFNGASHPFFPNNNRNNYSPGLNNHNYDRYNGYNNNSYNNDNAMNNYNLRNRDFYRIGNRTPNVFPNQYNDGNYLRRASKYYGNHPTGYFSNDYERLPMTRHNVNNNRNEQNFNTYNNAGTSYVGANVSNNVTETNSYNYQKGNEHKPGVQCYRCSQYGHRSDRCPYTFKQLAEMEEKGLIPPSNNQQSNLNL